MYIGASRIEKFWIWVAWRMPRELVYWCAIRLLTDKNPLNPDARIASDALKSWREAK
jgi:hypothetical protein